MPVSAIHSERPASDAAEALAPAPEAEPPDASPAAAERLTVAIAGASGFVGTALRQALAYDMNLVGLTRSPNRAARRDDGDPTRWRHCDLYSLREVERGLEGADLAIYLVHSMLPSSRLTQGTFADLDLILADNFARAAARNGVRQIVYLSGLLPEDTDDLSHHLRSRWEVERALASHGVPVTTLRTGLVVGKGGLIASHPGQLGAAAPGDAAPVVDRERHPAHRAPRRGPCDPPGAGRTESVRRRVRRGRPRGHELSRDAGADGRGARRRAAHLPRARHHAPSVDVVGEPDHQEPARPGRAADREPAPRHGRPPESRPRCHRRRRAPLSRGAPPIHRPGGPAVSQRPPEPPRGR